MLSSKPSATVTVKEYDIFTRSGAATVRIVFGGASRSAGLSGDII